MQKQPQNFASSEMIIDRVRIRGSIGEQRSGFNSQMQNCLSICSACQHATTVMTNIPTTEGF